MPCKFMLMTLVLLQQTVRVSVHLLSEWDVRHIYLLALALLSSCVLPSVMCSVRDRHRTMHLILESMCMMLLTALYMNHLLESGTASDAVVVLQVMLTHIFYNLSRIAHENPHKTLLAYRETVSGVGILASMMFPLMLAVRCPGREVDMQMVLLVMFAGEITGFVVLLCCVLVGALSAAYEKLWEY